MGKRIAIVQSSYIPWKGYFDLIGMVDEFILLDDVQYTRCSWRSRNMIRTPAGRAWLTIPIAHRFGQRIDEAQTVDADWARRHWSTLAFYYGKAAHFAEYRDRIERIYTQCAALRLSLINYHFLTAICKMLGIQTRLSWSMEHRDIPTGRNERLIALCRATGASEYLSGPRAKAYIDESMFRRNGIALTYMDYAGYPEYLQSHPGFEHQVSILDLLFNVGAQASHFMKSSQWICQS